MSWWHGSFSAHSPPHPLNLDYFRFCVHYKNCVSTVASGVATISHSRTLSNGTVEAADVSDIKYPNYFGEGRVLGGNPAYASVRAKRELVVYYITREDLEGLLRYSRDTLE